MRVLIDFVVMQSRGIGEKWERGEEKNRSARECDAKQSSVSRKWRTNLNRPARVHEVSSSSSSSRETVITKKKRERNTKKEFVDWSQTKQQSEKKGN